MTLRNDPLQAASSSPIMPTTPFVQPDKPKEVSEDVLKSVLKVD
jgi:hypothetical protein